MDLQQSNLWSVIMSVDESIIFDTIAKNTLSASCQAVMQDNAMQYKEISNSPLYEKILNGNEVMDARVFTEKSKNKFCYDTAEGKWYNWKGYFWEKDYRNEALDNIEVVVNYYYEKIMELKLYINLAYASNDETAAREYKEIEAKLYTRIKQLNTNNRRKSVLSLAAMGKHSLAIKGDEWDRHPMILACENGVIDLTSGTLKESNPGDYIKCHAPTEWRGLDCPSPVWDNFLLEIFDGNTEIVNYLLRLLGYGITGMTTEHVMPVFYGQGRNGKGTIFEVLGKILGDIAKPCGHELLVELSSSKSGGAASPDIMDLMGRRMAWTSEVDDNRSFNMSKVKRLTGNDSLKGRHLYKDIVTFEPTHKLFLLTNSKPHADASDYAFWKRIQLLNFPISFVDDPVKDNERKRNPNLMQELLREKSGILASLVRGCLEWQRINISPPNQILLDSQEYQLSEDILGIFIDDVCHIGPDMKVSGGELYDAYRKWAADNGHRAWSNARFGKKMTVNYEKYKGNGSVYYRGLSIPK